MSDKAAKRLVVGITGATGVIYGVRLLEVLRELDVETHLVMSQWATRTLLHETTYQPDDVKRLASRCYAVQDMGAAISSGSFLTDGMIVAPCSMKSLAAIAHGFGENLLHRAADVTLKERRPLVIVPREAPLSQIHLENLLRLSRMGAIIFPPVPAFYHRPTSLDDVITYTVVRMLDQLGLHHRATDRWDGVMGTGSSRDSSTRE